MSEVIERARSLRSKIEEMAAEHIEDSEATGYSELFPSWDGNGREYRAGDRVRYAGILFKVLQDHTSQPGWDPEGAVSLFSKVLIPDPDVIPVWEKPESTNAYMTGDKVHYPAADGPVYESAIDNNVWSRLNTRRDGKRFERRIDMEALLLAMSIPSGITGFCFWLLQRKLDKREKAREEKEEVREQQEFLMVKSIGAAIALGEASAIALKNGHTNGETEAALEYARQVKHEQKDFLTRQGIESIY